MYNKTGDLRRKKEDLDKLAENEAIPQVERNQYGKKYKEMGYQLRLT